jgi:hypothetical protein
MSYFTKENARLHATKGGKQLRQSSHIRFTVLDVMNITGTCLSYLQYMIDEYGLDLRTITLTKFMETLTKLKNMDPAIKNPYQEFKPDINSKLLR